MMRVCILGSDDLRDFSAVSNWLLRKLDVKFFGDLFRILSALTFIG